jgi:hypothetical protein
LASGGGVKAKTTLGLPNGWATGVKDGSNYTFNGSWQGAGTTINGDWTSSDYVYVWVKYSGFTGNLQLKIEYDEWTANQPWGKSYAQQSVSFTDASGVLSIAIDKTTLFNNGSDENAHDHDGEVYAKHVRQVVLQDAGAASTVTLEGLYVGTWAELLADMGYDTSKNHVLKVFNSSAKTNIWDNSTTYALSSTLTSGKEYTVTAKICAADMSDGCMVKFVLGGGADKYGDEIAILPNTFHLISQKFTAGNNTRIEIDLGFVNGTVFIDDVSCVEEGETTNLVDNGDFEEPLSTAGWSVPGYTAQTLSHAEQAIDAVSLPAQKFTIGASGYTTICALAPVQVPASINAYYAKYDSGKGNVKLTPVTSIHQYGRAILNGTAGDYYFPQIAAGDVTASWDDNSLEVSWGSTKGNGSTIYALGKKNEVVGFYLVKNDVTIPSGKAYLVVAAAGREFIGFGEDDATGVNEVRGQKEDVRSEYFNLAGQRVAQPTRGLYIVNGKKVIIK